MSTRSDPQAEPFAGGYKLLDVLAQGSSGVVYRAIDTTLDWEVAVKVLHDRFDPESESAGRFVEGARIAARLSHPGIPPMMNLGKLPDGRPFLVMTLIRGRTLQELLEARPDTVADGQRFLRDFDIVCQVIGFAHEKGVVHRDLKPAHVMIGSYGEVQLIGWGSARELDSPSGDDPAPPPGLQAGVGTPAYLPPEQALGGAADQRSDVFCLGGILCTILTGHPPFGASNVFAAMRQAAAGDVAEAFTRLDRCRADPVWVGLAKRCLSPRPADRPSDAGAVAALIASDREAGRPRR